MFSVLFVLSCLCEAQTTTAPSTTKVYKNTEHGFALTYPTAWQEQQTQPPNVIALMTPASSENDAYFESVAVGINPLPYAMTLDEYTQAIVGTFKGEASITVLSEGKAQVGTLPAYFIALTNTLSPEMKITQRVFNVVKDTKAFFITCSALSTEDAAFKSQCENVVKTFKFE